MSDDVRALALVYSGGQLDVAFAPMPLRAGDGESWADEPLDIALNPAEWERQDELTLPPELEARRQLVQAAVRGPTRDRLRPCSTRSEPTT